MAALELHSGRTRHVGSHITRLCLYLLTSPRQLDWNFQVDSAESTANIPDELRGIMGRLKLTSDGAEGNRELMQSPRLVLTRPGGDEVEETILKTSILLPFRDTPFLIEISVSKAWPRMLTHLEPESWWG